VHLQSGIASRERRQLQV